MYAELYKKLRETGKVRSAVFLDGPRAGSRCLLSEEGGAQTCSGREEDWTPYLPELLNTEETKTVRVQGREILVELFADAPHLVLLGGGHISLFAAELGKMLGFHVTVMDDRKEFVSEERFPMADERICGDYSRIPDKLPLYGNAYYAVITRGHLGDAQCVRQLLRRPYRYLGMIGSRRKVALTWELLEKEGVSRELLDTVRAPIGLPIGGRKPEEIAVSILAEILQVKNSRRLAESDPEAVKAAAAGLPGVMLTIVKKEGSSPRDVGSKMFVDAAGRTCGSIGGGNVEYAAMRRAPVVKTPEIRRYALSGEDASGPGMICGGDVEVLFEPVPGSGAGPDEL